MQEFIYYNKNGLDFPLNEKIQVTTNLDDIKDKNFLISNTKDVKSELIVNKKLLEGQVILIILQLLLKKPNIYLTCLK